MYVNDCVEAEQFLAKICLRGFVAVVPLRPDFTPQLQLSLTSPLFVLS